MEENAVSRVTFTTAASQYLPIISGNDLSVYLERPSVFLFFFFHPICTNKDSDLILFDCRQIFRNFEDKIIEENTTWIRKTTICSWNLEYLHILNKIQNSLNRLNYASSLQAYQSLFSPILCNTCCLRKFWYNIELTWWQNGGMHQGGTDSSVVYAQVQSAWSTSRMILLCKEI